MSIQKSIPTFCLLLLTLFLINQSSSGQMIRTQNPFTTVGTSFHERLGIDFGFHFNGTPVNRIGDRTRGVFGLGPNGQLQPNIAFRQGSVNSAIPPFGGYDPGAEGNFGYRVQNDRGGYNLGFRFSQGRTSTLTNTTPVLVTPNGVNGSIFSGTVTPFVTGLTPVVGGASFPQGQPTYIHPLEYKLRQLHLDQKHHRSQALSENKTRVATQPSRTYSNPESTATRGDISVAEIKRNRKLKEQQESLAEQRKAREYARKAKEHYESGNLLAARASMRNAVRYARGNQKELYQAQLEKLLLKD